MRLGRWEKALLAVAAVSLGVLITARTLGARATSQEGVMSRVARPSIAFWGEPVDVELRVSAQGLPSCGTTASTDPIYVSLVIDRSGSMAGQPLTEARNAASDFVDLMNLAEAGDAVSVIGFDDQAYQLLPFAQDRAEAVQAIQGITEGGGTNIAAALEQVVQQYGAQSLPANVRRLVVLLSDGQSDPSSAINIANQIKSQGVRIVTIAFGDADRGTLAQIASAEEDYFETTESTELMDIYSGIAKPIVGMTATRASVEEYVNTEQFNLVGNLYRAQQRNNQIVWQLPFISQRGRSVGYLLSPLALGLHTVNSAPGQVQLTDCNGQAVNQTTPVGPQVLVLFPIWLLYIAPALTLLWSLYRFLAWWRRPKAAGRYVPPPTRRDQPQIPTPTRREAQPGSGTAMTHGWAIETLTDKHGRPFTLRSQAPSPEEVQQALQTARNLTIRIHASTEGRTYGRTELTLEAASELDQRTGISTPIAYASLDTIFVEVANRRAGIGSQMLTRAEAIVRECGARKVYGTLSSDEVWPFFEEHGYQLRGRQVFKML